MSDFSEKFGDSYLKPLGYVVEAVETPTYKHRFGGSSWKVVDEQPIEDQPALLFVLDLTDPKLAQFGINFLEELPIFSYINSDVWSHEQMFKLDNRRNQCFVLTKYTQNIHILPHADRMPNPLPERKIFLRDMREFEYPIDEDAYWANTDDLLGGNSFFRVAGNPLWLQNKVEVKCSCGSDMKYIMCIGYERWDGKYQYIDNMPFFIGEAALYAFFCKTCSNLKVISQSS